MQRKSKPGTYCTLSPEGDWGITGCKPHDQDYYKIKKMRKASDNRLKQAVLKGSNQKMHWLTRIVVNVLGRKIVSKIYYIAVRIFGRLVV